MAFLSSRPARGGPIPLAPPDHDRYITIVMV
jgi:hypothetical protein